MVVSTPGLARPESITLLLHASCPGCHHWFDRYQIRIVPGGNDSHAQPLLCTNCSRRVLALGGNSAHESFASLLTEPRPSVSEANSPAAARFHPASQLFGGLSMSFASIAGLGIIQDRYPPGRPDLPMAMTRASFEQSRAVSSTPFNWRWGVRGRAVQRTTAEDDNDRQAAADMSTLTGAFVKLAKTVKDRLHSSEGRQEMARGIYPPAFFSSHMRSRSQEEYHQQQRQDYSSSSGEEEPHALDEARKRTALQERRHQATLQRQQEQFANQCHCGDDCDCLRSCSCSHQAVASASRRSSSGISMHGAIPNWNVGYIPGLTEWDPHHRVGESSRGPNISVRRRRQVRDHPEDFDQLERMGAWMPNQ